MTTLYEIFSKRTDRYSDSNLYPKPDIAREPIARFPYALFGPTIVTHFPLFHKSHEDDAFRVHAAAFGSFISGRIDSAAPTHETIRHILAKLKDDRSALDAIQKERGAVEEAVNLVWATCHGAVQSTIREQPELFVFNAQTRIDLEVNRTAHNSVVNSITHPNNPHCSLWSRPAILQYAFHITEETVAQFLARLRPILWEFQNRAFSKDDELPDRLQAGLGGIISWFEAADKLGAKKIRETQFNNRKLIGLGHPKPNEHTHEFEPQIDEYLLWRRGDRNWRYTFCEGIYNYPKIECTQNLKLFVKRLLSSRSLINSFPQADFPDNYPFKDYPFPGSRIAGAQYFVIPAELVVLILHHIEGIFQDVVISPSKSVSLRFDLDFRSTNGESRSTVLKRLSDLENAVGKSLSSLGVQQTRSMWSIEQLVQGRPSTVQGLLAVAEELAERLSILRRQIEKGVLEKHEKARFFETTFYGLFVAMAELLWKYIYTSEYYSVGQDDFVSSAVIDGRAIYLSNFRPYETQPDPTIDDSDVGFTRTFFVDFCLTPYQRGRLLRRLCDIATHRLSCVKDLDRFHALQDGINQLNKEFNSLVSETAHLGYPQDVDRIGDALTRALSLYRRALQFDMFVTEGVSGRTSAAAGDWEMIKKQISDIREDRLPGYALLGDFLERGLAVSALELGQIADRYENLISRIGDHMSTIRTQLTGMHSNEMMQLMRTVQGQVKESTSLLEQAHILVWIGGTYYLTSIFGDMARAYFEGREPKFDFVLEIGIVVGALFCVLVFTSIMVWIRRKFRITTTRLVQFLYRKRKHSGSGQRK